MLVRFKINQGQMQAWKRKCESNTTSDIFWQAVVYKGFSDLYLPDHLWVLKHLCLFLSQLAAEPAYPLTLFKERVLPLEKWNTPNKPWSGEIWAWALWEKEWCAWTYGWHVYVGERGLANQTLERSGGLGQRLPTGSLQTWGKILILQKQAASRHCNDMLISCKAMIMGHFQFNSLFLLEVGSERMRCSERMGAVSYTHLRAHET